MTWDYRSKAFHRAQDFYSGRDVAYHLFDIPPDPQGSNPLAEFVECSGTKDPGFKDRREFIKADFGQAWRTYLGTLEARGKKIGQHLDLHVIAKHAGVAIEANSVVAISEICGYATGGGGRDYMRVTLVPEIKLDGQRFFHDPHREKTLSFGDEGKAHLAIFADAIFDKTFFPAVIFSGEEPAAPKYEPCAGKIYLHMQRKACGNPRFMPSAVP